MIYFDAAATTMEKPPAVAEAVRRAMADCASPGRGGYAASGAADEILLSCRLAAAALFDAQPQQVVFTMNATHGLNIAIHSLIKPGDRVVISGYEHNAVLRPLYRLQAALTVIDTPLFQPEAFLCRLQQVLRRSCRAVVMTHVSNVFGWRLPVEQAAQLCRERGVPLIVDASQSAGTLPVRLRHLGAAFIAMPGHKGLYGPQGTGLLLCAQPGQPLLCGGTGSQSRQPEMPAELPERHEAGTANVPGIAGLLAGINFITSTGTDQIFRHARSLLQQAIPLTARYGLRPVCGREQTGVLSLLCRGDCEEMADALAQRGICTRAGLHCAPLAHQSAGTLEQGTLRLSFSAFNHPAQLDTLAQALAEIGQK